MASPSIGDPRYPAEARSIADDYRTIVLNRVSWGAILAGVVMALVTHLLLNLLGLGIGLSTFDIGGGDDPQASTLSMSAAIWWIVAGVISAFVGGYVAGRLTGQPESSTGGWHGIVTWALTTLLIFCLLTSSATSMVGGALNRLGGIGQMAAQMTGGRDPFAAIEREFSRTGADDATRQSLMAAFRATVTGNEADARAAEEQAVQALMRARGISQEEAQQQIGQWRQSYQQAAQQARQAAEGARKVASQAAIFGVIGLLLGAIAGWLGGAAGHPRHDRSHGYRRSDRDV